MTRFRLRPSFSFLTVMLVALAGFAQQQSAKPETGSSPAQENPAVGVKPVPLTSSVASAPPAKAPDENAVISNSDHRLNVLLAGILVGARCVHFPGLTTPPLYSGLGGWGYSCGGGFWSYDRIGRPLYGFPYGPCREPVLSYGRGQINLKVEPKTAGVWINNGFAGTVASLKSNLWLDPGAYDLCIKAAGHADYCRRIYALSGKKLTVLARLATVPVEVNP
jgi:hypothetical protein